MHRVFNHASEEVLWATAKTYGWTVSGKFEACADCQLSNVQQKGVQKATQESSTVPGERIFMDITSVKVTSYGGNRFWLVVVDDATGMTWSVFLKRKSDLGNKMVNFLQRHAMTRIHFTRLQY